MKKLYLIRHAKSSWSDPELDDFIRPLAKRGKKDIVLMADRLVGAGILPEMIAASPAKRAKKTAQYLAKRIGCGKKNISYYPDLYLGALSYHLQLLDLLLHQVDILFLVGHNNSITELAEYLSGRSIGNVPTCGIVALEYQEAVDLTVAGRGHMLFFDFPKNSQIV